LRRQGGARLDGEGVSVKDSLDSLLVFGRAKKGRLAPLFDGGGGAASCPPPAPLVEEPFFIPTEPKGRTVVAVVNSTWGDPSYAGLCGVEFFDSKGQLLVVQRVEADEVDFDAWPELKIDPRQVENLIDGVMCA
jgi:hypothetical protein